MEISVLPRIQAASVFPRMWPGKDRAHYLRLDLSEAITAPPESVRSALETLLDSTRFSSYPDETALYPRLSEYVGVPPAQLLLTNGSDHAIQIVLRAFLDRGQRLQVMDPSFPIYAHVARTLGVPVRRVPLADDLSFDMAGYKREITPDTRLLILVNPNNPTGTAVSEEDIETIVSEFPHIPVMVDEAYFEYSGVSALDLLSEAPNLIILRSFSKAFGLAGLRLGYMVAAPGVIEHLSKLRLPFDINAFAIAAAKAHLSDLSHMREYIREIREVSKPLLDAFLAKSKIHYYPSAANFLLLKLKDRDAVVDHLCASGILVAPQRHPAIADTLRVGLAPEPEMMRFIQAMTDRPGART